MSILSKVMDTFRMNDGDIDDTDLFDTEDDYEVEDRDRSSRKSRFSQFPVMGQRNRWWHFLKEMNSW